MSTLDEIVQQLRHAARQIRKLESEAKTALYDYQNKDLHYKLMSEKARLLVGLPDSLDRVTKSLDTKLAQSLKSQIGAFSFSAKKAIKLDSVFYMSALLYPEDYVDGEVNDLENFISQLESIC